MGLLEEMGIDQETLDTVRSMMESGAEWADTAKVIAGDVMAAIDSGTATLQDLGLLEKPPGAPEGGRWAITATGEPVYLPPDFALVPGFGINSVQVGFVPEWIPVGNSRGENQIRRFLLIWHALGAQEEDVDRIGQMNPMEGVAPAGTSFDMLSSEDKRKYLANSYAVAAAKNRYEPAVFAGTWAALEQQALNLGWVPAPRGARGMGSTPGVPGEVCSGATVGVDGVPYRVIRCDRDDAARRLYAVSRGLAATPGALFSAQFGIETEAWRECTVPGLSQADLVACVERYRGEPGMAAELEQLYGPWKPFAAPGKFLQLVDGLDGSTYVVNETFGKQRGAKLWIVVTVGTTTLLVGGAATVGLGWLFFTKKGKRTFKKLFK